MWILGINWKWHDSSAALIDGDGRIWAFSEEERFSRVKHAWGDYPAMAAAHCLRTAGITWRDLDVVAVGWRFSNMVDSRDEAYAALFGEEATGTGGPELVFVEHHHAHGLSTFYASGFDEAAVLVVDGSGECEAMTIYSGDRGSGLVQKRQWDRRYSLGALYEATTRSLGFGVLDAGKTMGLAPYSWDRETFVLPLGDLLGGEHGRQGPTFDLSPELHYGYVMKKWVGYLADRFGSVTHPLDQLQDDPVAVTLAGTAQRTVEEAIRALYTEAVCLTGHRRVCLAGGVGLNCVANGRLPGPIYVPPFPHDAGVAIGAAWSVCPPTTTQRLESPYLGTDLHVNGELDQLAEAGFRITDYSPEVVLDLLLEEQIGAVAEGRAEVGPRALCHRSIIALPRLGNTRDRINARKSREPWRPLAPVTLPDYAPQLWPSQGLLELYMVGSTVVSEHARQVMPATAHVDGSTRPQVLYADQAPVVQSLLEGLRAAGMPPVLVNTSFNGRGEPIVDSAADAVRTFHEVDLDFLVIGDHLVRPARKPATEYRYR